MIKMTAETGKQAYEQLKVTENELKHELNDKFESVTSYLEKNITKLNSQTDKSSDQITKSIK